MDVFEALDIGWTQGYDGSNAQYINRDVVCFKCGNKIKFVGNDGLENVFPSPSEGLSIVAVQGHAHLFAFSNQAIKPTIYVYQYPSFRLVSELKEGATLEYVEMVFSTSDYLATVSGIPDNELSIWNYTTGDKLVSHKIDRIALTCMTFNPANWRQMCITTQSDISVWQIEQSNSLFTLKTNKLPLPSTDSCYSANNVRPTSTRASSRMSAVALSLPKSSHAGVWGPAAEEFDEYQDEKERIVPTKHVWTPTGNIIMGFEGGQLMQIDGESFALSMLYNPGPRATSAGSHIGREMSDIAESSTSGLGYSSLLTDGSVQSMILHKKGLFVAGVDGTVKMLEITTKGEINLIQSYPTGYPVTSLSFNPSHNSVAVGSNRGSIHVLEPGEAAGNVKVLFDTHCSQLVSMGTKKIQDLDFCVTVREDGELQIWQTDDAKLCGSTNIGQQACSLSISPLAPVAVVGCESGYVFFVNISNVEDPCIIHRMHLHQGPVLQLEFNDNGALLLTGSDDGHIFVVQGRPSKKFEPIGYVAFEGRIKAIGTHFSQDTLQTRVVVTSSVQPAQAEGATRLIYFYLSHDVTTNAQVQHASLKCDFKDDAIEKIAYNFASPSHGILVLDNNTVLTMSQTTKQLGKIVLPSGPPKKEFSKDSYLKPVGEFHGHHLPGGTLRFPSGISKWMASGGGDGRILVRSVATLERGTEANGHSFKDGGVRVLAFTSDASRLVSVGYDNTLTCYKIRFSNAPKAKSVADAGQAYVASLTKDSQIEEQILAQMKAVPLRPNSGTEKAEQELSEKDQELEKALDNDMIYTTPTPVLGEDTSWLKIKEIDAHKEEDKQYSELKKNLRIHIRDMRRKLQIMMKENETLPDIEKLSHHDFDLDTEEQSRLEAEGEADVNRIREEIEFENLAKIYLAELIKKECWDDMVVKGRALLAFNNAVEVHNYPMKQRSPEEMKELERVKLQRTTEVTELKERHELTENAQKSKASAEEDVQESEDAESATEVDRAATTGSLGAHYGGASDLLHSQFELHTREQKMNQIVLLQDAIYRIKMAFNVQFDSVFEKKEQEIAKIRDKNKRIKKILEDINLEESVFEPQLSVMEKPEMLLTVQDEEVQVEKFLTPAQRKKLEEEEKAEEERRLKEKGDNWRDRGLDMMMGGVLEIKKEDELKKDVPVPVFMTSKPEEEWSEDEKKAAQEYEKKVKDLAEEREKYKKQLEMELKKLQSLIQDGTMQFDEALQQLFIKKIKTEMVTYQEELKIQRLKQSLLFEEELDNREQELTDLYEHKKKIKGLATLAVAEARKYMDEFHEQYRNLEVEEKLLDKNFKKEFSHVPAVVADSLYKLFRRRPRGQKARGTETPMNDPNSGNPFADRPSTARKNKEYMKYLDVALSELDKESNAPEGCELEVWLKLCSYRRDKVAKEQLVKQKAQVLADMEDFWKKRLTEDENLRLELDEIAESINKLKEDRLRFTCNLEVQLLLKQGQVEVDAGNYIHNYKDSLLLHRNMVEELNGKIRQLGETKIASMMESKDFRKGIIQLEWEHKKMTMEMEDLQNKMRDIQNLKVTREIQSFLNEDDHDAKKAQEISTLEQTITLMKQHHDKNVRERKSVIRDLMKVIRDKEDENKALNEELEDLNVSVNERRHIHDVNEDKRTDAGREQKYKEIVQRRKLVDLAKAQAQEVAVLRAEVERLRMRTFPALVQIEH